MWLAAWVWIPGTALLLFAMPMLFPDGHLPSSRWRPVAAVVVVGVVMSMLGHALAVWPLRDTLVPLGKNFMAADQPGLGGVLASIGDSIMFLVAPPTAVAALVMRYRRSTGVAREQLRWLTFAIVVASTVTVASQLAELGAARRECGGGRHPRAGPDRPDGRDPSLPPVRHRPDHQPDARVGGRDVAPRGGLRGRQPAAPGRRSPGSPGSDTIAVAASTLLVATLFQPIRRRVQAPLDRRFDRAYVDGGRVVSAFGVSGTRRGRPRPAQRRRHLGGGRRWRPASASVWLRVAP